MPCSTIAVAAQAGMEVEEPRNAARKEAAFP